jgi:RND family efflux transporter MFP subunit
MYKKITMIALCSLLLNGCFKQDKQEAIETKSKVIKTLNIKDSNSFKNSTQYPAQIHSFQNSIMAFELSGKIVKFYFNIGDKIKKGNLIAKLDDTIYKAKFNSAKATFEKAKLDYERYTKLHRTKSVSQVQYEQAKQNLDISESNYNIAKKNLQNTILKAEFDGVIAKKYVDDFARVTAKQKIIALQDNSKFKVKFFVPENDIIKANKSLNIEDINKRINLFVTLNSDQNKKYNAKLIDISTEAESVTRTYEITALINNPKTTNILPGMTAKIIINLINNNNTQIYIPLSSIFTDHSKSSFVWKINNGKVNKVEVQTGKLQQNKIEIIKGLHSGDKIAVSGVNLLNENDKIEEYKKLGN